MARYGIVLFDVGETLVGPAESWGAVYRRVLSELGTELPRERLDAGIRETSTEMARRIPPGHDRFAHFEGGESEYWRRFVARVLLHATGREADAGFVRRALDQLWQAFGRRAAWRVYDDVRPALDTLRREGARLAVVSNWDSRLPRLLELLDLAGYFESIGVSHVEGVEKPDPELFRRVLERLGAGPDNALHVGNVAEYDVVGARAAGVDAVLIDRAGGSSPGITTIRDLRELPPIVAGR